MPEEITPQITLMEISDKVTNLAEEVRRLSLDSK